MSENTPVKKKKPTIAEKIKSVDLEQFKPSFKALNDAVKEESKKSKDLDSWPTSIYPMATMFCHSICRTGFSAKLFDPEQ